MESSTRIESPASGPDPVVESGTEEESGLAPVSVIVPVTERPEPLGALYEEYAPPIRRTGRRFEFLFVTVPWTEELAGPLEDLRRAGEPVRVLKAGQTLGEGALLKLALERCRGEILLTLPAYHRVEPEAIPRLLEEVERGADCVMARRWPRRDSWVNRLQNRVFHALLRGMSGQEINDSACGVRAMRREVLREIPLYGDFFRFLPVLAREEGYRVEEISAPQHPKDARPRVYGPGIYLRRLIDLLGLFFLTRFTYKPLRFFGLIGSLLSAGGGGILIVVFLQRMAGEPLADRPLLLLGVLLVTLGVQAFALGLIGEIIVHLNAPSRRSYRLRDSSDDGE